MPETRRADIGSGSFIFKYNIDYVDWKTGGNMLTVECKSDSAQCDSVSQYADIYPIVITCECFKSICDQAILAKLVKYNKCVVLLLPPTLDLL